MGDARAIYSYGLRNTYRLERRESTGAIYGSEVGPMDWEEINRIEYGENYGWPLVTGPAGDPNYKDPDFAYRHAPDGCAITGGAFYEPAAPSFPAQYTTNSSMGIIALDG